MIQLEKVNKYFNRRKKNEIHVINNVSLKLENKGLVALLGASGSGKTTLLNVIGGLDGVKSGKIYINNERITKRSAYRIDKIRNLNIGYIFQDYKLVDTMSVYDNVALVLKMIGLKDKKEIKKRVDYILNSLNIYRFRYRLASMLSGGERQRVAIARALVKNPDIILADEPTGNLDAKNTLEIMNIIKSISEKKLVILVTHEEKLAKFYADRILEVEDGTIKKDYINDKEGSLDYRLENNIYLKDLNKQENLESKLGNILLYEQDAKKLDITIAVVNNTIYIESKGKENIEVVDENSNIKLVNEHYEEIKHQDAALKNFAFENIINENYKKRYASINNIFTVIISGFKKITNYSLIKKFLLLGYMAASMFILFSVARIFAVNTVKDEDFVTVNKNYIEVNMISVTNDVYDEISSLENIKYVLPGDSIVSLMISYNTYLQNYNRANESFNGSLVDISLISDDDLIYGRMPKEKNEIVVDTMTLNSLYSEMGNAKQAGLSDRSKLIGYTLKLDNTNLEYKLVGICDLKSPSIYVNKDIMLDMAFSQVMDDQNKFGSLNAYDYKLEKGRYPTADNEVLVNYKSKDFYALNENLNKKINGEKIKVVGYYSTDIDSENVFLGTENLLRNVFINKSKKLMVISSTKEETTEELKELGFNAKDSYKAAKDNYIKENQDSVKSVLIFSGIIIGISLIEIYLMVRSSFLSRIKEVGIYRAIGVKKRDIYKMFLGEILAITLAASLAGIALMGYILWNVSKIKILGSMVIINYQTIGLSILICFAFNIIVGLIPVYKVISRTPSEILARHDI
jgi:putative ABC transport system permease protein